MNAIEYYVSIVFGENIKITCSDLSKCKIRYSSWYTPVLSYYDSSNFYAGSSILYRLRPNGNNFDQLINIKVNFFLKKFIIKIFLILIRLEDTIVFLQFQMLILIMQEIS